MQELTELLRKRLSVIADHAFRDRDPEAHLAALQEVSMAIMNLHQKLAEESPLPPRLEHFLANCSYDKALDFLENSTGL